MCLQILGNMNNIPFFSNQVPSISTDQMIEVDRLMIEEFSIQLLQMMENAGSNLAHLARFRFLRNDPSNKKVIVLAGSGGNGGGAMVCARRLSNYGCKTLVILSKPDKNMTKVTGHQLHILKKMGIKILHWDGNEFNIEPDLIIDGLIGYGLKGNPHGNEEEMILWANSQFSPIISLDNPSGMDANTGKYYNPTIQATATMTLALPKKGLLKNENQDIVGELYLADISVPPSLYERSPINLHIEPIFAESDIVRLK